MFKICNDKAYYVVQTTSEDVVVEIYTKKDGRGSDINLHEVHLDLCRAIRKLQHDGYTIMKVYPAMGDRRESIDVLSMPEFIQSAKSPDNVDDALDEFYRIQQTGEYWQPDGNKTLDDAIHECRWAILKDALMQRGHDAVADFIGTDVSSDSYERLLDETEAQMPSEEFEKFWKKYI